MEPNSNARPSANPILIDIGRPATWPSSVLEFLARNHELFCQWEQDASQVGAKAYDRAIGELQELLRPFAPKGWHCTRLTDQEIDQVLADGILLPDLTLLEARIDALVARGLVENDIADRLKTRNLASDKNRAGMVWFCFFSPAIAGEGGIGRSFRHWGREALYNSHEGDPLTSPVLRGIGTPCLIEAHVPISSLAVHGGPVFKIVREYIHSLRTVAVERFDYEGRIVHQLPATHVSRVIRSPEPDFITLTGCAAWKAPPVEGSVRG